MDGTNNLNNIYNTDNMCHTPRENGGGKLRVVFGDVTLGLHGGGFSYIFSYMRAGLESLVRDGVEWLYRAPRPAFWRALTDNDRGNGFALRSGMWLAADQFIAGTGTQVWVDGKERPLLTGPANNRYSDREYADRVKIAFRYQTVTVPAAEVLVSYEVSADGAIAVDVHYFGKPKLPELPVFGMRFIMPTKAVSCRYEGLSGETYPDRMAGGVPGVYEVSGHVTPYLVPQDCGVHMQTKWFEVCRNTVLSNVTKGVSSAASAGRKGEALSAGDGGTAGTSRLRFEMTERPFAFSCLPYTPQELESATHQEELPLARRTVVSVFGAVRGVGGMDSWGADVEEPYRISGEKDIAYSFRIGGIL